MSAMSNAQTLVRSYLFLRKCIGVIGIALPIVLVIGKIILGSPGISDSISAYYYTVMRNIFVGSLCAIGIFLICYRYEQLDTILSIAAGGFAIGVAFFPAAPDVGATEQQLEIGVVHLVCATCFFSILAIFALVLFRKTDQERTPRKKQRDVVYLFCGIVIVACLVLLLVQKFLPGYPWLQPLHPVFWLESLAIFAFGIAWFVKGETILKDE